MDEDELPANPWRQARRSITQTAVGAMAAQGRRPAFDARGNVRGFRSRPGAPLAGSESMSGLALPTNPTGGLTNNSAWGGFFKGNSPTGVRMGYMANNPAIAAAAQQASGAVAAASKPFQWNTTSPTPSFLTDPKGFATGGTGANSYLGNVISSATDFFRKRGLFSDPLLEG